MLTVPPLTLSQSERIVWPCEELGIPYRLVVHERLPDTKLAPPSLVALTPMGTGPVIEDGDLVMSESGAIVEYLTVFSLTTMRVFAPLDLSPYPGILAYLQRVGARPAYREAMRRGDPGLEPMPR